MDNKKQLLYVLKPIIDIVFATVGVVVLALIFSFTKEWFKVSNELDWIAALLFFFGIRIGNRLDLLPKGTEGSRAEPRDTSRGVTG